MPTTFSVSLLFSRTKNKNHLFAHKNLKIPIRFGYPLKKTYYIVCVCKSNEKMISNYVLLFGIYRSDVENMAIWIMNFSVKYNPIKNIDRFNNVLRLKYQKHRQWELISLKLLWILLLYYLN